MLLFFYTFISKITTVHKLLYVTQTIFCFFKLITSSKYFIESRIITNLFFFKDKLYFIISIIFKILRHHFFIMLWFYAAILSIIIFASSKKSHLNATGSSLRTSSIYFIHCNSCVCRVACFFLFHTSPSNF